MAAPPRVMPPGGRAQILQAQPRLGSAAMGFSAASNAPRVQGQSLAMAMPSSRPLQAQTPNFPRPMAASVKFPGSQAAASVKFPGSQALSPSNRLNGSARLDAASGSKTVLGTGAFSVPLPQGFTPGARPAEVATTKTPGVAVTARSPPVITARSVNPTLVASHSSGALRPRILSVAQATPAIPAQTGIVGKWGYGLKRKDGTTVNTSYVIKRHEGELIFAQSIGGGQTLRGELVLDGERDPLDTACYVALLFKSDGVSDGDSYGKIRLRYKDGKVASNFQALDSEDWSDEIWSTRQVNDNSDDEEEPEQSDLVSNDCSYSGRLATLKTKLLSSAIQVPLPKECEEVPSRLSVEEVNQVFIRHVPGVKGFLFRGQAGNPSLRLLNACYFQGMVGYANTPMHNHMMWLFRGIVHHGHENKPGSAKYLRQVAEAFQDCQAVQGRVVETVGLEVSGVSFDFHGLVTGLVGEYKTITLKMLAVERVSKGLAGYHHPSDAANFEPAHYENRLFADLGDKLGLNADDIRRARLDPHGMRGRYTRLLVKDRIRARQRFKELFDMKALMAGFISQVNSFSAASETESMPSRFLAWVDEKMAQKHVVFDEDTCMRVEVGDDLALAIFEILFLAGARAEPQDTYRDIQISDLFLPS